MAKKRKQLEIRGTERPTIEAIEESAEAYVEARDTRAEWSKKESQKRAELLAVMRAHKIKTYKWLDDDGEEIEALIDDEPKVKVRRTGDSEPDADVLPEHEGLPGNGIHAGLIAQAERDMAAAGVAITGDGDVVTPDVAKPKKPRKKKAST